MILLSIARITLLENVRRKVVVALAILTIVVALLTLWGFSHLSTATDESGLRLTPDAIKLVASQLFIFLAFAFSGILALLAALVSGPAMASALETGIALSILARPIRRSTLFIGTWLGLVTLVVGYTIGAGGAEILVSAIATGYVPPDPLSLLVAMSGVGISLVTLTLTVSTRLGAITSGVLVIVGFFVCWISGIVGAVGTALNNSALSNAGSITHLAFPTDGLWRAALYAMEPPTALAFASAVGRRAGANPFLAATPPSVAYWMWCAAWILAIGAIGVAGINRREI